MSERRATYRAGSCEHEEQAVVIAWAGRMQAARPELALLHAVPNGGSLTWQTDRRGQRYSLAGKRLKREGMKAGVPDLCLPVARGGYHGLYLEMKYGDNKPTPEQHWWLERLSEQGYLAVVCWSATEAIEVLEEYLGSDG